MLRLTGLMSNPGQMPLAYVTYSETGQDEREGLRGGKKTVHDFSDSFEFLQVIRRLVWAAKKNSEEWRI